MNTPTPYEADLSAWRAALDASLRADDGWLTLAGLHWLGAGENTVGGHPGSDVPLPDGTPERVGVLALRDGVVTLHPADGVPVLLDGAPVEAPAALRDDHSEAGPSLVTLGGVTFYVIRRSDQYGIRVRDVNSAVRQAFSGRMWFPADPAYRVAGSFTPYPTPRTLPVLNSVGMTVPMDNPGVVSFTLDGAALTLEAFAAGEGELWFIFKDATNGHETYGAGRFLTAPLGAAGAVDLDFNRAYNPPCAFTAYATCPLAPRENGLPLRVAAGERV